MGNSLAILVVDDQASMRNLIRKSLVAEGYDYVIEAVDGKDALFALEEYKVDLIISDLEMPHMGGIEFLQKILADKRFQKIPFIVLTSDTTNDTFKKAMTIGAADYIQKPFTQSALVVKIKSILEWL